jgi:hypothetical protein
VEVLEVKGVVPDLIYMIAFELGLSHFEFYGKDRGAGNERGVEAAAETGHVEFQEDGSFEASQGSLQD